VLYVGGPAAAYERTAKEFKQRYPGIAGSVTGGFANVRDREIDDRLAARPPKSTWPSCRRCRIWSPGKRGVRPHGTSCADQSSCG
jgi:hypothetical protein